MKSYTRREASKLMAQISAGSLITPSLLPYSQGAIRTREIPSSGELLPVVGLGTWQSFDKGNDANALKQLAQVLLKMKEKGGRLIDSSPMYGSSERVVGQLTTDLKIQDHFFYATKVWTHGKRSGIEQMQQSMHKMKRSSMDLMQIHNLLDWKEHAKTLKEWKEIGKIRYWGITHYTNSSHGTLADIIKSDRPDFVQFNYSINQRNAEKRLLNIAAEHGTAVIINRPYEGGTLFRKTKGKTLPNWCKPLDIHSWGQYFLKYILAHKAVNCVIPGTSKPHHVEDNMMAGYGKLPDRQTRKRMVAHLESI